MRRGAGGERVEAGRAVHQGGLAGARGPHDRGEAAGRKADAHPVQGPTAVSPLPYTFTASTTRAAVRRPGSGGGHAHRPCPGGHGRTARPGRTAAASTRPRRSRRRRSGGRARRSASRPDRAARRRSGLHGRHGPPRPRQTVRRRTVTTPMTTAAQISGKKRIHGPGPPFQSPGCSCRSSPRMRVLSLMTRAWLRGGGRVVVRPAAVRVPPREYAAPSGCFPGVRLRQCPQRVVQHRLPRQLRRADQAVVVQGAGQDRHAAAAAPQAAVGDHRAQPLRVGVQERRGAGRRG